MKNLLHSALFQQCLGAVIGGVLALGLYEAGSWTYTKAQAMLVSPESKQEIHVQTQDARMERVGASAKEMLERK